MDKNARVLISREEIDKAVSRIAGEIQHDYHGKMPLFICILKGSFIFCSDLIRKINIPLEVDFVKVSSYGKGTTSSGKIKIVHALKTPVKGRHVLIVEDIIDTGLTVSEIINYLDKKKPLSIKICALTDKPERRKVPVKIDYLGFKVPDKFLVGYGLDWDEKYRHLPNISTLE